MTPKLTAERIEKAHGVDYSGIMMATRVNAGHGDFCIVRDSRGNSLYDYFVSIGLPVNVHGFSNEEAPPEIIVVSVLFSLFQKAKYVAVINGKFGEDTLCIDWMDNYYSGVCQLLTKLMRNNIGMKQINFVVAFDDMRFIVADSVNYLNNRIKECR